MTTFFQTIFTRYPIKTRRSLELLPGVVSWTLILSPIWGSFFIPYIMAYFILFFDVYWLYRSFSLTFTAFIASRKIAQAQNLDWLTKVDKLSHFYKVAHIVIIPNYTEGVHKLRLTLQALAEQTFPRKRIYVVLAMEQREKAAEEKASILIKEFKGVFGRIFATYHPDSPNEIRGKSSNQAYAARVADEELIKKKIITVDYTTVSSVDADSIFDKQYFAYLTYEFLKDPKRYNKFWQSATVYYNNFWRVPAPIRVISFFGSLWRTGVLVQKDRLISNSTYTLSFKLLKQIGFWDTDVIPEDYRIFFKAFFALKGNVWVDPIFLRTSMDAPMSSGYFKSLKNKYQQEQRWSWGASDDPLFIKWWLTIPGVPFVRKTVILYNVLLDHFLWPVNWFIITIGANIMPFVNPAFSRTTIGYNLPRLAGFILTLCLFAIVVMIVIDFRNNPKQAQSPMRKFLFPLEFVLLPVVGFFLTTLPAIFSHTQLMLGKRIEYKTTEKI
ncbi:MAG: glycosyltransferase family 2 protein [Candidatus Levybacteria bacterium]|nr:glycosyltransferase family 2 protein [Candidatus Levybacteria bacterium]